MARLVTDKLDGGLHAHFVAAYTGDGVNFLASESPDGIITTVAGNGIQALVATGSWGVNALVGSSDDTAVDSKGNLYIADAVKSSHS